MALELRPNCEYCDEDLPPASTRARICSFECTFCADCVENKLPIRPAIEWRPGLSVAKRPPSSKRMYLSFDLGEIAAHSRRISDIPPENR